MAQGDIRMISGWHHGALQGDIRMESTYNPNEILMKSGWNQDGIRIALAMGIRMTSANAF
jgi:hypothetical protein